MRDGKRMVSKWIEDNTASDQVSFALTGKSMKAKK
jgi:hypothetical protein